MADHATPTVRDVSYELLRKLGLTTVFGNPGSTEEAFLKNFPGDFRFVLAAALRRRGPTVLEVPIDPAVPPLL